MMEQRKYVADLQKQEKVTEIYLCTRKHLACDRNSRRFLNVTLADRTGQVDALLWEDAERRSERFSSFDLVEINGTVVMYQGRLQVHLNDIYRADSTNLPLEEFFRRSLFDPDRMWAELTSLLHSIQDPHLSQLIAQYLGDLTLLQGLRVSTAARSIHHAYVGGLLEHTLSVVGLTEKICGHYQTAAPGLLNRDLCLTGAFLHDLGKIWEISSEQGFQYTDQGRLLGHLVLGLQFLNQKLSTLENFPPVLADHLRHIILSHHGKLEHGSPKRPKTAEALVIHRADQLDGHLGCLRDIFSQNPASGWTAYQPLYEQYFFNGWPCGDGNEKI